MTSEEGRPVFLLAIATAGWLATMSAVAVLFLLAAAVNATRFGSDLLETYDPVRAIWFIAAGGVLFTAGPGGIWLITKNRVWLVLTLIATGVALLFLGVYVANALRAG